MFSLIDRLRSREGADDMARRLPVDEAKVLRYLDALLSSGTDRVAFDATLREMSNSRDLTAGDVQEIARRYAGGGQRASSKKAALAAITVRFTEGVRAEKKNATASRARPL